MINDHNLIITKNGRREQCKQVQQRIFSERKNVLEKKEREREYVLKTTDNRTEEKRAARG